MVIIRFGFQVDRRYGLRVVVVVQVYRMEMQAQQAAGQEDQGSASQ
ncbi:MAG: hypothetical protein IT482_08285 [Gammaproteobacteria bacterium]|nr:hypothetical protein [Gammaproteobacteria bacterium]